MMRTVQRVLGLVVLGSAVGLLCNAFSPRGIPLVPPPKKPAPSSEFVPLQKAQELWSSGGALFFDARSPEDFAAGHIPTAQNLPVEQFQQEYVKFAPMLTPESAIVVYCDGTECELSHRLAADLRQQGYTNVHILFDGWTVWRTAGLPTESAPPK